MIGEMIIRSLVQLTDRDNAFVQVCNYVNITNIMSQSPSLFCIPRNTRPVLWVFSARVVKLMLLCFFFNCSGLSSQGHHTYVICKYMPKLEVIGLVQGLEFRVNSSPDSIQSGRNTLDKLLNQFKHYLISVISRVFNSAVLWSSWISELYKAPITSLIWQNVNYSSFILFNYDPSTFLRIQKP